MKDKEKEPPLTHALGPSGRLVSIKSVKNGLACNCRCPKCHEYLMAKKGEVRLYHFAHMDDSVCHGAYMSALHIRAEEIIEERKAVMVPHYKDIEEKRLNFIEVEVEKRVDRKDIQPDIVGITEDGVRWAIEILNTHEVNDVKIAKLKESGLNCLEIDVSDQQIEELECFLLESVYGRAWINIPYYDSLIDKRRIELFKEYEDNTQYKIRPKSYCKESCNYRISNDKCICLERILPVGGEEYSVCNVEKKRKTEEESDVYIRENKNKEKLSKFVPPRTEEAFLPQNIVTNDNLPFARFWNIEDYYNYLSKERIYEYEDGKFATIYACDKTQYRIIFLYVEPKGSRHFLRYHISIIFVSNGQLRISRLDYKDMDTALSDYDVHLNIIRQEDELGRASEIDDDNLPF